MIKMAKNCKKWLNFFLRFNRQNINSKKLKFEFEILGEYDYKILSIIGKSLSMLGHSVNYYLTSEEELGNLYDKKFAEYIKSKNIPNLTFIRDYSVDACISLQAPLLNARKYIRNIKILYGVNFIQQHGFTAHKSTLLYLDGVLSHGPYTTSQISKYIPKSRIVNINGIISCDECLRKDISKEEILKKNGIGFDKKIIVYMPTWDEHSSIDLFYEALLDLREKYTLITRPHDSIYVTYHGSKDGYYEREDPENFVTYRFNQFERITKLEKISTHILKMNVPLHELVAIADILLIDSKSGVMTETLLCDESKPIVGLTPLYNYDIAKRYDKKILEVGPILNNPDHLVKTVENLLLNDNFKIGRKKIKKLCFGKKCDRSLENSVVGILKLANMPTNNEQRTTVSNINRKNKKSRIVFIVREPAKNYFTHLYKELESDGNKFEPIVVVIKHIQHTMEDYNKSLIFFKSLYSNVFKGYDEDNEQSVDLRELSPDVVFYDQPWCLPPKYTVEYVSQFARTCYIPYAYADPPKIIRLLAESFYLKLWKYFVVKGSAKQLYPLLKSRKSLMHIAGHVKLDAFKSHYNRNNKFYVIFAPHSSITENSILKYGTFKWSGLYMLEFAQQHKNFNWLFKPHPSLKYNLVHEKVMTKTEAENYYNEWEKVGDAFYDGDYFDFFKNSQVLITDCGSFLVEYLPTGNPCIHLRSKMIESVSDYYSCINIEVMKVYYQSWNINDLEKNLYKLLIEKKDPMKYKRLKVIRKLGLDKYNNSSKVINYLRDQLSCLPVKRGAKILQ
ncbi:MAG: CDP-glycerol glycerophosphotransferase family protein [Endomicrobium sp.]|jgi:hypothetical protein|uniref:hypothetical protein n=1 Tax=Candidatus Endomicrobiellum cubanum TaxID=3242325 RepID=UPI0028285610|nr:CDP-glycerol glycerophosphotransferase family protein [Endomicrobium sp.]